MISTKYFVRIDYIEKNKKGVRPIDVENWFDELIKQANLENDIYDVEYWTWTPASGPYICFYCYDMQIAEKAEALLKMAVSKGGGKVYE